VTGDTGSDYLDVDLKLDLLCLNREYPQPDFGGFNSVLADFEKLAKSESFAENMDYLLKLKVVSSECATYLMPKFKVGSPEVDLVSTFSFVEWLYDDVVDGEHGNDAFFPTTIEKILNVKLCGELILGREKNPCEGLSFPMKKGIERSVLLFQEKAPLVVEGYPGISTFFLDSWARLHASQEWILIDNHLTTLKNQELTSSETEFCRRIGSCGATCMLELSLLLHRVIPSNKMRDSFLMNAIEEAMCTITMLINDIFSIEREMMNTAGQNCVAKRGNTKERTLRLIHTTTQKIQRETRRIRKLFKLFETMFGHLDSNITGKYIMCVKHIIDGTIFFHLNCKRYSSGVTFELVPL